MTVNGLCPGCHHEQARHYATLGSIHCNQCGAICGERSADYRGTEERTKRRHFAECRGGPADGTRFSFEGPPPAVYFVPREIEPYDFVSVGVVDDFLSSIYNTAPPDPWAYRPLVTNAGYARNAEWRFIYEFAG